MLDLDHDDSSLRNSRFYAMTRARTDKFKPEGEQPHIPFKKRGLINYESLLTEKNVGHVLACPTARKL
jgi:hypothetical protein